MTSAISRKSTGTGSPWRSDCLKLRIRLRKLLKPTFLPLHAPNTSDNSICQPISLILLPLTHAPSHSTLHYTAPHYTHSSPDTLITDTTSHMFVLLFLSLFSYTPLCTVLPTFLSHTDVCPVSCCSCSSSTAVGHWAVPGLFWRRGVVVRCAGCVCGG